MSYLALIGDIRASRAISNRGEVQSVLRNVCSDLNRKAEVLQIVSPFTVTLGDEFQVLFSGAEGVWKSIFEFELRLAPVRVRYGMGIGVLNTDINTESAIGMDGPAFHLARDAVNSMKAAGGSYRVEGMGASQQLLKHSLDLVSLSRDGWRANRVAVLRDLLNGKDVSSIARTLAISRQAVYKNIREGGLDSIVGLFNGASQLMDRRIGEAR